MPSKYCADTDFSLFRKRVAIGSGVTLKKGLTVVVPMHKGKTLPLGTPRAIMQGAEIPEDEWRTN
jgi:predicted RNA binding protein YcfA (HicA-like mRNA interferase family)